MKNIFGMTLETMQEEFAALPLEKYRAKQVTEWLYKKYAKHFSDMTNLPKTLRAELSMKYRIVLPCARDSMPLMAGRASSCSLFPTVRQWKPYSCASLTATAYAYRRRLVVVWAAPSAPRPCMGWHVT